MTVTAITGTLDANNPLFDTTYTLAAGVAKVVVLDCRDSKQVSISIINTGVTNAIGTTKVELGLTNEVAAYQDQTGVDSAIGSIAASSISIYDKFDDDRRFIQMTFTSASGTTLRLQGIGR